MNTEPANTKLITPEQHSYIMATVDKYKDGKMVRWDQLLAEHPDIAELFDNKRQLTNLYYRANPQSHLNSPTGNRRRTDSTKWTPEEIAELVAIAEAYQGQGPRGSISWSTAKDEGRLAQLLSRHSYTDIMARWSYQNRKHTYRRTAKTKLKKQHRRAQDTAITIAEQDVEAARKAEVARQLNNQTTESAPVRCDYCPRCGLHIANVNIKE